MRLTQIIAAAMLSAFSQCAGYAHRFVCAMAADGAVEHTVRENVADRIFDIENGPAGIVAVSGFDDHPNRTLERRIETWSDPDAPRPGAVIRMRQIEGEGLTVVSGRVWYSAAGNYGGKWGVVFVDGEGKTPATFLELPFTGPVRWLPLGGAQVAGLYVSDASSSANVKLVTPGGVIREWELPRPLATSVIAGAALPEARTALAAIAHAEGRGPAVVVLYLLESNGDQPAYTEQRIAAGDFLRMALAAQSDGTVGILLQATNATIQFAQVQTSGEAVVRSLSPPSDTAQVPVIAASADGRYLAAWYARENRGTIVARSIDRSSPMSLPGVTVGQGTLPPQSLALEIVRDGDVLAAVWPRGSAIVSRALPQGFEAAELLREEVCGQERDLLKTFVKLGDDDVSVKPTM